MTIHHAYRTGRHLVTILSLVSFLVIIFCLSSTGNGFELAVPEEGLDALNTHGPKPIMIPLSDIRVVHKIPAQQPMYLFQSPRPAVPPPESSWIRREKSWYREIFEGRQYRLLVVPVQVSHYPVNQSSRLLMTSRLCREIEATTDLSVAPWWMVHRALGGNSNGYNEIDVRNFARMLGVEYIVWTYAGYSPMWKKDSYDSLPLKRQYHFDVVMEKTLTLQKTSTPDVSLFPHKRWTVKAASRSQLPSQAISGIIEELMAFMDLPAKRSDSSPPAINIGKDSVPEIPKNRQELFSTDDQDPISQALKLQFLAMLSSTKAEYLHELLLIRSLEPVCRLDPELPMVRLLYARAYHYLNRRPAALAMLNSPETPSEKAFVEYLNANIPELKQHVENIHHPLLKSMAELELHHLTTLYFTRKEQKDLTAERDLSKGWDYFFERIKEDENYWRRYSNLELKSILDIDLPLKDFSLKHAIQGAVLAGRLEEKATALELLVFEHLRIYLKDHRATLLSGFANPGPTMLDYLLFLENIAESNLVRSVLFQSHTQSNYTSAIHLLNEYADVYKEHPNFTLLYADAQLSMLSQKRGAAMGNLRDEVFLNGLKALYWAGGANRVSDEAYGIMRNLSKQPGKGISPGKLFGRWEAIGNTMREEFPLLSRFESDFPSTDNEYRLPWAHTEFYLFRYAYNQLMKRRIQDRKARLNAILDMIKGRFHGSPERLKFLAELAIGRGDISGAIDLFSEEIETGTDAWEPYHELGKIYVKQGKYDEAKAVFLSYPPFSSPEKYNSVGLSNNSYEAGSHLFWKGAIEMAAPLYRIAAELHTGSDSSLASEARLHMVEGDLSKSAVIQRRRAIRYDNPYAYRDFICLLFLMDEPESAWALFHELQNRFKSPQIWSAAYVGHRLRHLDNHQLCEWLDKQAGKKKQDWQLGFVARYALLQLMDRPADLDFARSIHRLDNIDGYRFDGRRWYGPDGEFMGPQRRHYIPEEDLNSGMNRISFYGTVAEAYTHMKMKDFQAAYDLLNLYISYFSFATEVGGPILPLFVRSCIKTGNNKDPIRVRTALNMIRHVRGAEHNDCYVFVSMAQLLAHEGKHSEAAEYLKNAFNVRPHDEKRPFFTLHQLVEYAEWLYGDSNFEPYRELLLEWAVSYQKVCPWDAWTYAVEAKWSKDSQKAIRALGIANHLDPMSQRISDFSEQEKATADRWFEAHKPFASKETKNGI